MRFFSRTEGSSPAVEPELPFPARPEPPPASSPQLTPGADSNPAPSATRKKRAALLRALPWKFRLAAYGLTAMAAGSALWLGAMLVYYTITFPNPLAVRAKERAPVIRIVARDGTLLSERGAAHDYVPIDMVPRHVVDAVVATEDRRFFQHWGIDPAGLVRAAFANLRAGRYVQGGSTLTQQLAKNLFLTSERTVSRKLDEFALAVWLEVRLGKREILELYLNRVYFGGGAYGIEAAAQRYFDKSARGLSLAEGALIAGLLKAPSKYSPTSSPDAARARGQSVLAKMRDAGLISIADHAQARKQRIEFADLKGAKATTGFEYAIDHVLERLPPLLGSEHDQLIVETTIDAQLQKRANALVQTYLDGRGKELKASQAALVTIDTDGGIRALIGGRSYAESQFNRATKARRQPGSVFKPFVYLAALERGTRPDTITYDLPLTIDNWSPRNDSGQHVGALTVRQALAQSVNTVAVRLSLDVGLPAVSEAARRLGVQSELREDPSMALGTSELNLLELASAYGVLANGGSSVEPHVIRRVRLSTGRVLYAHAAQVGPRVVSLGHVGAMNDMLNAALVAGTGKRAALPRHPAAGKTGTTQDFRDAWFVGYTAHMTTGVWIGNDDGSPMRRVMGGNLPAEIWRDVMLEAHRDRTPEALPGTSPSGSVSDRGGTPVASTTDSETLPWLVPPPPVTSSHIQRAPGSRSLSAVRAQTAAQKAPSAAPLPGRPTTIRSAATRGPAIGQRLVVEPPKPVVGRPGAPTYPAGRIDDEFLARVLRPDAGAAPASVAQGANGFDAAEIARRLEALPADAAPRDAPRGMMSLGASP